MSLSARKIARHLARNARLPSSSSSAAAATSYNGLRACTLSTSIPAAKAESSTDSSTNAAAGADGTTHFGFQTVTEAEKKDRGQRRRTLPWPS